MDDKRKQRHAVKLPDFQIAEVKPLGHCRKIEACLRSCGIWTVAQNQLPEVYYYIQDGRLNEIGHWQVNRLFKNDLTILPGTEDRAWLFETYFDYLRYRST